MPVPFTANAGGELIIRLVLGLENSHLRSVLAVRKLDARFWSSGCLNGLLVTRLSKIGFALLKTLRL